MLYIIYYILHIIFFWHSILAFYLASILTSYLASFLASVLTFSLAFILAFFLAFYFYLTFLLTFYSASILTFSRTCVEVQQWPLAAICSSRLRSGSAHWNRWEEGEEDELETLTWQVGENVMVFFHKTSNSVRPIYDDHSTLSRRP